jgi:hypothetical protein
MSKKALLIAVAIVLAINVDVVVAANFEWWNSTWKYRIGITINNSGYNRTNWPVEVFINFSDLGYEGTFDNNSIRVIEYWPNGSIKDAGDGNGIVCQFDKDSGYNASSNAAGVLIWQMGGMRQADANYTYFVYFDFLEDGGKQPPAYVTSLSLTNVSGAEFWVNTSELEVRVDTGYNHKYHVSGMYYARLKDTGAVVFNATGKVLPIEYTIYSDEVSSYTPDFRGSFTVVSQGPLRLVVEEEGDEVNLTSDYTKTPTGNRVRKRYTFYEGVRWVKVEQTFIPNGSVTRKAETTALALDIGRTMLNPSEDDYVGSWSPEPSWVSVNDSNLGLGVVNIREEGTTAYRAGWDAMLERIGVELSQISFDHVIGETAAVYFSDEGPSTRSMVETLRDSFSKDILIYQGSPEKWNVSIEAFTDNDANNLSNVYNWNETATIYGNIVFDSDKFVNVTVNVTLNNGTEDPSDDIEVEMSYIGGNLWAANYTIPVYATVGVWKYNVTIYDKTGYPLNWSSNTFNVTNQLILIIVGPWDMWTKTDKGIVNQSIFFANITVKNYRDTLGVEGQLNCQYNSSPPTLIENWTYNGDGLYSLNFTAPSTMGVWNFSCNLSKWGNIGSNSSMFETTEANTTTMDTLVTSINSSIFGITYYKGQKFNITVNATNTGWGMAFYANISIDVPSGWSAFPTESQCPILGPMTSCFRDFEITVPANTPPDNYTIQANTTWRNYDGSFNSSLGELIIFVEPNPQIDIKEAWLNLSASEGTTTLFVNNITIEAVGNVPLSNIEIACDSGWVCSFFDIFFEPQFISTSISPGPSNSRKVNISIVVPEGYPPRDYDGIADGIVVARVEGGDVNDSVYFDLEVPESRTWEVYPTSCDKITPPDKSGEICEVEVNNTGNLNISFSITKTGNGTNFIDSNLTSLVIERGKTGKFRITYNTTNTEAGDTYVVVFQLKANESNAIPSTKNVTVNLKVESGPIVEVQLSPQYGEQNSTIIIFANITDKIGEGIEWVKANITTPIGNILPLTLYNTSPNIPGGESNWSGTFTDTLERGNYTVIVYVRDLAGGYGVSAPSNFTIYAKLQISVVVGDVYEPGDSDRFKITVSDLQGNLIDGAMVVVDLVDKEGFRISEDWPKTDITEGGKVAISFQLPSSAGGLYTWTVEVNYTDRGQTVSANSSGSFFVGSIEVSTSTTEEQYSPGDIVTILTTVVITDDNGSRLSVVDNVTVTISMNGTIEEINSTLIPGPAYVAEYIIPADASAGTYVIKTTAYYLGVISRTDIDTFTILEAGPSSLQLDLDAGGPYRPGDTVLIKTEVRDQNNEHLQGANITLRVEDPDGIIIGEQNLTNFSSPSYVNFTLATNATEGTYRVYGEARYGSKSTSDIELFDVYKSLFAQIGVLPVYYLNSTMEISVMILDPDTGSGVDPDSITLNLYNTENSTLTLTHSLSMANLTRESAGFYTYSENLINNTPTGSYLALLEVTYGTIRAWGMETFRISSGVFDIKFENVSSPIPRGGDLEFTITLTYFGEATTRDITLQYVIVGTSYSGSDTFKNPDPNTPTTINRTISNVDLPGGTYTLRASVMYDPAAPPAVSEIQFEVTSREEAPPPPMVGGGAAAEEEVGPPVLLISRILPEEVHVERGGSAALIITLNNSGEAAVQGISISLEGLNRNWYEVVKSTTTLEAGEIFDILIKINVPEDAEGGVYPFNITITSQETTVKREVRVRVFESRKELVEFELEATEKRLHLVQKRLIKAMSEGRNVTEGLDYIDKATESLSEAKRYLKAGEYSEALLAIEAAMAHLDRVNEIIDKAPLIIRETIPTVTPQPTPVIPTKMLIGIGALILVLILIVAFFGIKWYKSFKEFAENIDMRIGPVRSVPQPREKKSPKPIRPTTEKKSLPKPSDKFLELRAERDKVRKLLDMLNAQRRDGLISKTTYRELKEKNEKRLREIEEKLKELS